MGTNYYLHTNVCECCDRPENILHIGKSSCGWCFSLHVDPSENINDLNNWILLFNMPNAIIKDEYNEIITIDEMLNIITNRSSKKSKKPHLYKDWSEFHKENHSENGPNGLIRHKIDGIHCIGHANGTWDMIKGEFS